MIEVNVNVKPEKPKKSEKFSSLVGLASRLDFGSDRFRTGLVKRAWRTFEGRGVGYVSVAGGLVNGRVLMKSLSAKTRGVKADKKAGIRNAFINEQVEQLVKALPEIHRAGDKSDLIKIYIVTCEPYDGLIGCEIAKRLEERRSDLVHWGHVTPESPSVQNLLVKGVDKTVRVLVPYRTPWRGKYFGTAMDRLVEDDERRSGSTRPDAYVIGCVASTVWKPTGNVRKDRFTIPALHNLGGINSAENQVGVVVLDFENGQPLENVINFGDMLQQERESLKPGIFKGLSLNEKRVLRAIIRTGSNTAGVIEYNCDKEKPGTLTREHIDVALASLEKKGILCRNGVKWEICSKIMRDLTYGNGVATLNEDAILVFGCMHAGHKKLRANYFIERAVQLSVRDKVRYIFGVGDFVNGWRHFQRERKEAWSELDHEDQRLFAARLTGTVLFKIFEARLQGCDCAKIKEGKILESIKDYLCDFIFIRGNHDEWEEDTGHKALYVFKEHLIDILYRNILNLLVDKKLAVDPRQLLDFVKQHIVYLNDPDREDGGAYTCKLASGLVVAMHHHHSGGAKNSTLKLENVMDFKLFWKAQVVLLANFHVDVGLALWDPDIGQREGIEVGTLLASTAFESGRTKSVKSGMAVARIRSNSCRIKETLRFFDNAEEFRAKEPKYHDLESATKALNLIS